MPWHLSLGAIVASCDGHDTAPRTACNADLNAKGHARVDGWEGGVTVDLKHARCASCIGPQRHGTASAERRSRFCRGGAEVEEHGEKYECSHGVLQCSVGGSTWGLRSRGLRDGTGVMAQDERDVLRQVDARKHRRARVLKADAIGMRAVDATPDVVAASSKRSRWFKGCGATSPAAGRATLSRPSSRAGAPSPTQSPGGSSRP